MPKKKKTKTKAKKKTFMVKAICDTCGGRFVTQSEGYSPPVKGSKLKSECKENGCFGSLIAITTFS